MEFKEKIVSKDKQIAAVNERLVLLKETLVVEQKPKSKLSKLAKCLNIILLIVAIICMIFSLTIKFTGTEIDLFGYQFKRVLTASMEGEELPYEIATIPTDSLVVIDLVSEKNYQEFYSTLKVGDVITFLNMYLVDSFATTITHRIISIEEVLDSEQVVYEIITRGDNNPEYSVEKFVSTDNIVVGKVVAQSVVLGSIHKAITSKNGVLYIVLIPAGLIMLLAIYKLYIIISDDKVNNLAKAIKTELDTIILDIDSINTQYKLTDAELSGQIILEDESNETGKEQHYIKEK